MWVKLEFTVGERLSFIPGLLELQFIENEGMAFGWALPGAAGKLILTVFRLIAAVGIGIYIQKLCVQRMHTGLLASLAFIWAGAIGNIIDSAFYGLIFSESSWGLQAEFLGENGGYARFLMGNVVDMFHFTTRWPGWWPISGMRGYEIFPPIWNLSDAAISCGVIWILIKQKTYFTTAAESDSETHEAKSRET